MSWACRRGPPWENTAKPALNNTPSEAPILVQVSPRNAHFHVTKREVSEDGTFDIRCCAATGSWLSGVLGRHPAPF